jgi:hypothetical protein
MRGFTRDVALSPQVDVITAAPMLHHEGYFGA